MALSPELLIDFSVDFLVGLLYGYAGYLLTRRHVSEEARLATAMFSVWWFGLAATGFIAAAITLGAAANVELAVLVTLNLVVIIAFSLGLLGMVFYLTFLFTGRQNLLAPLSVLYGLYFALQVYLLNAQHPIGYDASGWRPVLLYDDPISGPAVAILLALPLVPLLIGILGLGGYLRRVEDKTLRYRIALIVTSLATWILAVVLISRPELAASALWQVLARLVILGSGMTILFAYQPPKWVQRRWGIHSSV